jgi:hypothetical protein
MKLFDIIKEQKSATRPLQASVSMSTISPKPSSTGSKKYGAVLVGGLTHGETLSEQITRLSSAIGKPVMGFSHNESMETIKSFLIQNPNLPIFLFSAGCRRSYLISKLSGVNLRKFYIIEPTYSGGETTTSVRDAVSNGVPASHVFVGSGPGRGEGIVSGASDSRTNPSNCHYCSLSSVGSMVNI